MKNQCKETILKCLVLILLLVVFAPTVRSEAASKTKVYSCFVDYTCLSEKNGKLKFKSSHYFTVTSYNANKKIYQAKYTKTKKKIIELKKSTNISVKYGSYYNKLSGGKKISLKRFKKEFKSAKADGESAQVLIYVKNNKIIKLMFVTP